MNFSEIINFRDWLDLMEGSFTEADIPKWFYVSIYFSKDLIGPKPGVTPPGAVATLVGLEGISASPNILGFMSTGNHSQIALQMPGKEVVRLNKLSRALHKNTDYLTSRGFRAGRRMKAGQKGYTQESIFNTVLARFFASVKNDLPDAIHRNGSAIMNSDGQLFTIDDVVNWLRTTSPKKAKNGNISDRKIPLSRERQLRHGENNLKNIVGLHDLKNRLLAFFKEKNINIEPLLQKALNAPQHEQDKSKLELHLQNSIQSNFNYEHEQEWILKRQHFVNDDGKPDAKPMLHVPAGTIMYLGKPDTNHFAAWAKQQLPNNFPYSYDRNHDAYKYLVNKFKLNRFYEIHFIEGSERARELAKTDLRPRPYDPERLDMLQKLKDFARKRIHRLDHIYRLLEREGLPQTKAVLYIKRLQEIGAISVDNGSITINHEFNTDEDGQVVLNALKSNKILETGVALSEIAKMTNLDEKEAENVLKQLITVGQAEQLSDGTYDYVLSKQEKNELSALEKDIVDYLTKVNGSYYYNLLDRIGTKHGLATNDNNGMLRQLRLLVKKGKVAVDDEGAFFAISEDKNLNPDMQQLLNFFKEWPISDRYTLENSTNFSSNQFKDALRGLLSKRYVAIVDGEFHLNKELVQPNPDAKNISKLNFMILETVTRHFVVRPSQLRNLVLKAYKHDLEEHIFERALSKMVNLGLVKQNKNKQYENAKVNEQLTLEEEFVLNLLKNQALPPSKVEKALGQEPSLTSSATGYILEKLERVKKINKTYDVVRGEEIYYGLEYEHKEDLEDYYNKIVDFMRDYPSLQSRAIFDEFADDFGRSSLENILDKMISSGKIKLGDDFSGKTVYFLPDHAPATEKYFSDAVMSVFESAPTEFYSYYTLFHDKLGENPALHQQGIRFVLDNLIQTGKLVKSHDKQNGEYVYHLPGVEIPSIDTEKVGKYITTVLNNGRQSATALRDLIWNEYEMDPQAIEKLFADLVEKKLIKVISDIAGKESWYYTDKFPFPDVLNTIYGTIKGKNNIATFEEIAKDLMDKFVGSKVHYMKLFLKKLIDEDYLTVAQGVYYSIRGWTPPKSAKPVTTPKPGFTPYTAQPTQQPPEVQPQTTPAQKEEDW